MTSTAPLISTAAIGPQPNGRRPKVGLVAGGLGAYWPQFPDLLPTLQRSAARVSQRLQAMDCEVVDVGFFGEVCVDGGGAAAVGDDFGDDFVGPFLAGGVVDDDRCAGGGEGFGDGGADAFGGARDDRDFTS